MRKLTTEDFIIKARLVHGNFYDYSKVDYINSGTKVCIICPEHGEFWQIPNNHLRGVRCKKCSGKLVSDTESFIEQATIRHNGFYSYPNTIYTGGVNKVAIECPKHGNFYQLPNVHLSGGGCKKCATEKLADSRRYSITDIAKKGNIVHNNKYTYPPQPVTNSYDKITIICPIHGDFIQRVSNHLSGNGCPACGVINIINSNTQFHRNKKQFEIYKPTPEKSKSIPLSRGKYTIVDEDDYELLNQYMWYMDNMGRAKNNSVGLMHRFLLNPPADKVVDHINNDPLDNRRSNLRVCTQQENIMNTPPVAGSTSKYKGVSWSKEKNMWVCNIGINRKTVYIGAFTDEIEAAKAYDEAAKKYHGEFAHLNFK